MYVHIYICILLVSVVGARKVVSEHQPAKKNHALRNSSAYLFQAFLLPVKSRWLWVHIKKPQLRVTDTGAHFRQKGISKGIIKHV